MDAPGQSGIDKVVEGLRPLVGRRISTAAAVREEHGRDESHHEHRPPDAVLFAETVDEVRAAVRLCAEHRVPVIPFGTGTSLEGHVTAVRGGLSIDMKGMNRILRVSAEDLDCTVEPGVTRKQLNAHLRDSGLFFPVDPGADASLGGMAATRASGTNAVRYGTMRENVISLGVVLADGSLVDTASRARKSSAGYDLTRLFVGSEGTLGVIVSVTLKLYGLPEAMAVARAAFPTIADAARTAISTIQAGIPVARVELLDEVQVRAVNRFSRLGLAETPSLLFEFHGSAASVSEQAEFARLIASDNGALNFDWVTAPEERTRLWQARHDVLYANKALLPGCRIWTSDVCVPLSALADCVVEAKADIERAGLIAPIVGHVGDGNFHVAFVLDPARPEQRAAAAAINARMVERAIAMGGTSTGEHGVGIGKMAYLEKEHGPGGLALMRAIKATLDPQGIMNPGKVVG